MSEVTAEQLRDARAFVATAIKAIEVDLRPDGYLDTIMKAVDLLTAHPLTLAALQAGAEERPPDYLAGQRFANRGDSGDWGLSDFDLVEVKGIIEAAIGDGAVVLVPRSE